MIPGRARNRKRFAQPGATRKEYRSQHVPGEELELKSQRLNMPMIGQTIPDGTMTPTDSLRLFWLALACTAWTFSAGACSYADSSKNALYQQTGEERSNIPKKQPPYYPNTAGNIVAPPGNPGGNSDGSPSLVGGNMNQSGGWPDGR